MFYILIFLDVVFTEQICKHLHVGTDIKKSKDDVILKGIVHKNWERKASMHFKQLENSIIQPAKINTDIFYITLPLSNLTIENFKLDFDDKYFADSKLLLDQRPSTTGKHTEYALKIDYRCKQYGGAMINYELDFSVPDCGDAQIYWKKICGNPLQQRDGFIVEMAYKNYKHIIIQDGEVTNSSYFDQDLDNYVFNIPKDVISLQFFLYMNTSYQAPWTDDFVLDAQTLKQMPAVNLSIPYVETDEKIAAAWFDGPLSQGGLVNQTSQQLNLNFKCRKFGTSKVELTIPFIYFKDITLYLIKDCTSGNKVQNVIQQKYDESDSESILIYVVFTFIALGLIINLCLGKKKGLANIPCFLTLSKLFLCITCLDRTSFGRSIGNFVGVYGDHNHMFEDEPDETFSVKQRKFYGSI